MERFVAIKIRITFTFRSRRLPIPLVVCPCRPFVNLLTSSAGLVGCRNFLCRSARAVDHWSSNRRLSQCRTTEVISTPNNTCRRCQQIAKRPTGTNTTNWMGRRRNLKIKVIPILILTELFPSVHETWYLKALILKTFIPASRKIHTVCMKQASKHSRVLCHRIIN